MIYGILITLIITGIIAFFWVRGIDHMHENHPDYRGEDFFGWDFDDDDEKNIT